ncbi:helix-turn-helix domain-containing protein [Dactylosporangium sp. CA-152071]|uniref:helix-turn-helix domain-containing protein n=1 Tax=Dactylosporangium sp. CA-152071 TaxID=3239933 RepID=UPI003D8FF7B9
MSQRCPGRMSRPPYAVPTPACGGVTTTVSMSKPCDIKASAARRGDGSTVGTSQRPDHVHRQPRLDSPAKASVHRRPAVPESTGRGGLVSDVPSRDDPATAASFGQLITRRRRQLGLTQGDLADQLCARSGRPTFTRHEISRYERGVRLPTAPLLTAIANSLDVPVAVLRRAAAADRERRQTGSR